ncbi:hypothetical protein [Sutterella sp.]|uniref:hypothetical protein n=1 Tax=Sutterella sp. TaxID=1981025 RepID=UPI0026E0591E|nr:hypothetical protein [Sutterella sp.]MDO5531331.1 hypothetical protein [Sutterella sp.]
MNPELARTIEEAVRARRNVDAWDAPGVIVAFETADGAAHALKVTDISPLEGTIEGYDLRTKTLTHWRLDAIRDVRILEH